MDSEPIYTDDEGMFGVRANRDMNSLSTFIDPKRCIYMLADIKNQSAIFLPHTILQFLSGLMCERMSFINKKNRKKKYKENERIYKFDRCLNLFESCLTEEEEEVDEHKVLKI